MIYQEKRLPQLKFDSRFNQLYIGSLMAPRFDDGPHGRIRTGYLSASNQVLYPLSYVGDIKPN